MKPNFLVIGAGRCGTTSLCAALERHPEIFICTPKEPGFFTEHHDRGWDWYESLFAKAAGKKAIGEGTNNCSKHALFPEAHRRIAEGLPGARLIYIVRHPLRRIESDWRYSRLAGIEPLPFPDALRLNAKYLETSDYLRQIDVYRRCFPDERILVLFTEDMHRDQNATLARCFEFLGVDPGFRAPAEERRNSADIGLRDRPVGSVLRRVPGMMRLRRGLPVGLWRRLRPLFRREVPAETPVWTREARDAALARLMSNSAVFLERYGKPRQFWPLESPSEDGS